MPRLFGYITPRIKAVFHNTTLTGNLLTKKSEYRLDSKEVNMALLEYDAGVQFSWGFLRLGYSVYGRGREYNSEKKGFHNWGGLYVGFVVKCK
jgi:hypothetical protein